MKTEQLRDCLERTPVIAAVQDPLWAEALKSPAEVIFYLSANLLTVKDRIGEARAAGKAVLIHLDLAEGIGRDRIGAEYLAGCGADGIISTRSQIIRAAKEAEILTVQRFFALDSKGIGGIEEMIEASRPDLIEIMPGVVGKVLRRFSAGGVSVIAGGLIETKAEVTDALSHGAIAVSTGKKDLWYL